MNQHIKYYFIFSIILNLFFGCKIGNKEKVSNNEPFQVKYDSLTNNLNSSVNKKETLVEFLDRAKKICQSSNENDLKKIITFPVFGHGTDEEGNNFKDSFPNVESLKNNPLIFNLLFKEHLALATKIVDNKTMGKDWYYVMSEGGLEGVNYSFKLKVIEDKFYITGFEIPGV